MNIFSLIGDFVHVMAFAILFFKILKTRSNTGISGKMHLLLAMVFMTRYLDLPTTFISVYITVMKIFFIGMSFAMLYLVYFKFPREDKEGDGFRVEFLIVLALVLALFVNHRSDFFEVWWTFSIYLEAMAICPQLFFVRITEEVDIYTCCSVFALATYRGFYILNWIFRYLNESHLDDISFSSGVVQTMLYCYTAALMIATYCKHTPKSKLAIVDVSKKDMIFVHPELKSLLHEEKEKEFAGSDGIKPHSDEINYPVHIYSENYLLKMENQFGKDEFLPHVFHQKNYKKPSYI